MRRFGECIGLFMFVVAIIISIPYYSEAARGVGVRPISPVGTEVKGNQWLFVIGIDTYIEWPRLKTAVSDAKSVRDVFFSRYHFDKDHLIELYDEHATRKKILNKLRYLAKNVEPEDSLVIFYAGHGHLDSITKEGSWIPVESGTKDVSAWISNHDIKNYLRVDAIKAKHILLISDSCFSGDFFRGHRGKLPEVTDEAIKRAYKLTSRQAIASGGLEPVSDAGFGNNSVFSHFFVKTLKENQQPFLVPSAFFSDVKAGVVENAEQFPQFGSLKDTGGQQGGELVLFLRQDSTLKALSAGAVERQKELDRLKQIEAAAKDARKREIEEIARREKELAGLDAKIGEMRKRLGSSVIRADDSLDAMLAMVQQKEEQERRLEELRRQREEEETKRQAEIAILKRESEEKIIAMLAPEVEKYKKIIRSKYGKNLKSEAWKSLVAKCPAGWTDEVAEGNTVSLLLSPDMRRRRMGRVAVDEGGRSDLGASRFVVEKSQQEEEKGLPRTTISGRCHGETKEIMGTWRLTTEKQYKIEIDGKKGICQSRGLWHKKWIDKVVLKDICRTGDNEWSAEELIRLSDTSRSLDEWIEVTLQLWGSTLEVDRSVHLLRDRPKIKEVVYYERID